MHYGNTQQTEQIKQAQQTDVVQSANVVHLERTEHTMQIEAAPLADFLYSAHQ